MLCRVYIFIDLCIIVLIKAKREKASYAFRVFDYGEIVIPILHILIKFVILFPVNVEKYTFPTQIHRFIKWLEIPLRGEDKCLYCKTWQIGKLIPEAIYILSC